MKVILQTHLYVCALYICLISVGVSCAVLQLEYRAHIDSDQHWKMVEACGFEGCYPMVDVLTGENMSIRLDFYRVQHGRLIYAKFTFGNADGEWTFNPSKIIAAVYGGKTISVKGFEYSRAIGDVQYLRAAPSIERPMQVRRGDRYILFIDYQVLAQETITMNINNALTLNGRSVNVPVIYFKRNPEFKK